MDTEKYTSAKSSRFFTNDLYLAAYLYDKGCEISVVCNDRRRITFVAESCPEVLAMRETYRSGHAFVSIDSFRDSLKRIRQLMDAEQRSALYGPYSRRGAGTAQARC